MKSKIQLWERLEFTRKQNLVIQDPFTFESKDGIVKNRAILGSIDQVCTKFKDLQTIEINILTWW